MRFIVLVLFVLAGEWAAAAEPADAVYHHARIYTVDEQHV